MRNIVTILCVFLSIPLFSQTIIQSHQTSGVYGKGVIYEKEHTAHFKFHTQGFALGYDFGKIDNYDVTEYYTLELGYIRHPKEYKQRIRAATSSILGRPVIYGKINNLMALRAMYKKKKYLSEKAKTKGIAVGYSYSFGLTAGILKPYYISVSDFDSPWIYNYKSIKYEESTRNQFLDYNSIAGAENFFKGLGEVSIVPGLSADISVVFDLGAYESFARSLEVGFMADIFTKVMPIMAENQNSSYFINAYFNIYFGQRW